IDAVAIAHGIPYNALAREQVASYLHSLPAHTVVAVVVSVLATRPRPCASFSVSHVLYCGCDCRVSRTRIGTKKCDRARGLFEAKATPQMDLLLYRVQYRYPKILLVCNPDVSYKSQHLDYR